MKEDDLKFLEQQVLVWSDQVNPRRRELALTLIAEVRRLRDEVERLKTQIFLYSQKGGAGVGD